MTTAGRPAVGVPRYVPILKGRRGEMDALGKVRMRTRRAMVPLVEVTPRDESEDVAAITRICDQTVERLARAYGHPLMLDGGHFDLRQDLGGGVGVVGLLAERARAAGLVAQPVLRLDDPDTARRDAGAAHAVDDRGLTVRLIGEDLEEDPDDLDAALQDLLGDTGTGRERVDLLLDLGPVEGDVAVRGGARLVLSLLRTLPEVTDWRTVTVAAGAFPVDLSQFTPNTIGERPRYDAQLFDQVRRRRLPRQPDYGDYAVAHPTLTLGGAYSPPPQLRYTASEHWLVLKGHKRDPLAHRQFHQICERIAAHPEFAGTPVGWADEKIARHSSEGPGNGTTWRTVGTAHHLDYVTLRLTTLGEP